MNYALAIKKLRNKMLLSQADLAKQLGVSFASVNRWENGRNEPTFSAKRKLKPFFDKYGIALEDKRNEQ